MEIYILRSQPIQKYSQFLDEAIVAASGSGNYVSSAEMLRVAQQFVSTFDDRRLTIFCTIHDKPFLLEYIMMLSRTGLLRRPKLVVLTTFLTWGSRAEVLSDTVGEQFLSRSPLSGWIDAYSLENRLWQSHKQTGAVLVLVGCGLLFGRDGYDLKSIFQAVFNGTNEIAVPGFGDFNNKVPMIHCDDFVNQLAKTITESERSKGPRYVPCCSRGSKSLRGVVSGLFESINGSSDCQLKGLSFEEAFAQGVDEEAWIWQTDISYSNPALCENRDVFESFADDWTTYLQSQNLSPCSMVFAGIPQSGKTTIAQEVAKQLSLKHVDTVSSVRYALTLGNISESKMNKIQHIDLSTLKSEMTTVIEAKLNEGKKGKKGEDVKLADMDVSTLDISAAVAEMPAKTIRSCLSLLLSLDDTCLRKGFVLDVWGSNAVGSPQDLLEILGKPHDPSVGVAESPVVDLIVDFQCPDSVIVKRLLHSLGIADTPLNKASKDAQAAVKALETQLAAYTGRLVDGKHPVISALADAKLAKNIVEINGELPLSDISVEIVQKLEEFHGPIGWVIKATPAKEETAKSVTENENENSNTLQLENNEAKQIDQTAAAREENKECSIPQNSFDALNQTLKSQLKEDDIQALRKKCMSLQDYLAETVLPQIAKGMIEIVRARPDDPIAYLSDYLLNSADIIQANAEREAIENFERILREAESQRKK